MAAASNLPTSDNGDDAAPNHQQRDDGLRFANEAPDNEEWTAHIKLLNEWSAPDRTLRDIIQYARSGPFYPADMHVHLIEQLLAQSHQQGYQQALAAALACAPGKLPEGVVQDDTGSLGIVNPSRRESFNAAIAAYQTNIQELK